MATLALTDGSERRADGLCVMEAAAWFAGWMSGPRTWRHGND